MLWFECQVCGILDFFHPKLCKNSTCHGILAVAKRVMFETIFSLFLEVI